MRISFFDQTRPDSQETLAPMMFRYYCRIQGLRWVLLISGRSVCMSLGDYMDQRAKVETINNYKIDVGVFGAFLF